jgi:hypothetical protein
VKTPLPTEERVTVPVGAVTLEVVSVTVTVQVLGAEIGTEVGLQATAVVVLSGTVWPTTIVACP